MVDENIRANLVKLRREIDSAIIEIDAELEESRPSLKLLVPRDNVEKKSKLLGNKEVLVFIQTLVEKSFYVKPEPEEDETNLNWFKEQVNKSITLIGENIKNVKSLHPSIGIPNLTEEQYAQLIGRQEMFNHFKSMLTDFNL
jgi:hypothetical protein